MSQPILSIDLPGPSPGTGEADAVYAVNAIVHAAATLAIRGPSGGSARTHLLVDRGLSGAMIRRSGLGYLPPGRTVIRDILFSAGASLEVGVQAGLLRRDRHRAARAFRSAHGREPADSEELTAFFRERCLGQANYYSDYYVIQSEGPDGRTRYHHGDWITLPIRAIDSKGELQIAGFQLRSMRPVEEIGKAGRYRTPVNTVALQWNETLIGLAELNAQRSRHPGSASEVIICEGAFDRYAVLQALAEVDPQVRPGVIALGGVAARGEGADGFGLGVLSRLGARQVTLFLDSDDRGLMGSLSIGQLLSAHGVAVRVATCEADLSLAGAKDPGELLSRGGPLAVQRALISAGDRHLGLFAADWAREQLRAQPNGGQLYQRLGVLEKVLPVLRALPDGEREAGTLAAQAATGFSAPVIETGMRRAAIRR